MLKRIKNDKKGFTLVELIVVLVILAILAALLIPSLTGYIEKAKQKQIVAETRQAVMAVQTLYDEAYGANSGATSISGAKDLAEVKGTISDVYVQDGKVTDLLYKTTDGKTCLYTGDDYVVGKTASDITTTDKTALTVTD
jgi:type IV pilus assembly protein PilA